MLKFVVSWGWAGSLAKTLDAEGFRLSRLKTGTPPRLDARTVNFSGMDRQPSDARPIPFSFLNMADMLWTPPVRQVRLMGLLSLGITLTAGSTTSSMHLSKAKEGTANDMRSHLYGLHMFNVHLQALQGINRDAFEPDT